MRADVLAMSPDDNPKQRRANIRLALLLAAVAAGVLVMFFWKIVSSSGAV